MGEKSKRLILYLDPSHPLTSLPPGIDSPGFEASFAEARLLLNVAYAGASKRVLVRLVKGLDPASRSLIRWMVKELRATRLVALPDYSTVPGLHITKGENHG